MTDCKEGEWLFEEGDLPSFEDNQCIIKTKKEEHWIPAQYSPMCESFNAYDCGWYDVVDVECWMIIPEIPERD